MHIYVYVGPCYIYSFTTRGTVTWNDKQVLSTLKFAGRSADLTIRSPWKNIDADYEVNGEMEAFNAKSNLKWGEGEQVKATANFDIKNVRGIKTSFSLESPLYSEFVTALVDYLLRHSSIISIHV